MRHLHIVNIVTVFVAYALIGVVLYEHEGGWGYIQPIGVVAVVAFLTLALQHSWSSLCSER